MDSRTFSLMQRVIFDGRFKRSRQKTTTQRFCLFVCSFVCFLFVSSECLAQSLLHKYNGTQAYEHFGQAVTILADLTGDGIPEFAVALHLTKTKMAKLWVK